MSSITENVASAINNGNFERRISSTEVTRRRHPVSPLETGGKNCQVKSFLLYGSKLNPKLKTFFQRPKDKIPADGPWFDNQVIGVKTIEKMMKIISKEANLKIYTNHSIRAICITLLYSADVEAMHIMSVSGHKCEQSKEGMQRPVLVSKEKYPNDIECFLGSVQNPTFNFSLDFDDDTDELPTQRLLMTINKTHCSNTGNTVWKCFSATEVPEEKPDCSKNPISALINNSSGQTDILTIVSSILEMFLYNC